MRWPKPVSEARHEDLARLVDQLWSPAVHDGNAAVTGGGTAVDGFEVVESYALVPSARRAQVLVPLGRPRHARRALLLYNGLRSRRTRMFRRILGEAVGMGVYSRRSGDRLVVHLRHGLDRAQRDDALLAAHLSGVLGIDSLTMSPGVRPAAPNSKPTALLLDGSGAPVGYLKVGWNVATARMVDNEARSLLGLVPGSMAGLDVPAVLHHGSWRGRPLLVTAPLPLRRPRRQPDDVVPPAALTLAVAGSAGLSTEPLRGSPYWDAVGTRLAAVEETTTAAEIREPLERLVAVLSERCGTDDVQLGGWHGDWVPWNLAWFGDRLAAWDWEHSSAPVPLGFDPLHYVFQVAFILRRQPLITALAQVDREAPALLEAVGVRTPASDVVSLYLLEQVLRSSTTARDGGGWNARFLGPLADALTARC